MQEDLLQPRLTVIESLSYAARLKIGRELSKEDKDKAVSKNYTSTIIIIFNGIIFNRQTCIYIYIYIHLGSAYIVIQTIKFHHIIIIQHTLLIKLCTPNII